MLIKGKEIWTLDISVWNFKICQTNSVTSSLLSVHLSLSLSLSIANNKIL